MRRAATLAAACALVCLVLAACTPGRKQASGKLLTRDAPVSNSDVVQSVDPPATPSADPADASNDPTPVVVHAAVARASSGGGASPARSAVVRPTPPRAVPFANLAAPGSKPDVWAVVIGIQAYQGGTHHTYGGDGDAAAFMQALSQAHWPADHILELTDGAATGPAIRQAMQWLVAHSGPNTFSLFHYSGHVCIQSTGPCGAGHKYLWSVENQFISDDEFASAMRGLQGQAWVDIAGCEAAAFNEGIATPQRLFTGSSAANEKSYEDQTWHESVWTGFVVDQGMLQGQADSNGDHRVTVQEAVQWAQGHATDYTKGQANGPQHPVISGGSGSWDLTAMAAPPPPPPPSSGGGGSGGGGSPPPAQSPGCSPLTKAVLHC